MYTQEVINTHYVYSVLHVRRGQHCPAGVQGKGVRGTGGHLVTVVIVKKVLVVTETK